MAPPADDAPPAQRLPHGTEESTKHREETPTPGPGRTHPGPDGPQLTPGPPIDAMTPTTLEIVTHIREWSLQQVRYGTQSAGDAHSLVEEFREWIDPATDELEILSLDENQKLPTE